MIGQWQGEWQGHWQGATGAPGAMFAAGLISVGGAGELIGARVQERPQEVVGGGVEYHRVRAFYEEQERIAAEIRQQNEMIIATVVALVAAGELE